MIPTARAYDEHFSGSVALNTAALGNRQLPTCSTSALTKYRGVAYRLLHVFPHRKNKEEEDKRVYTNASVFLESLQLVA